MLWATLRRAASGGMMPPLTDPTRLAAYRDALSNWSFAGFIQFELNATAYAWLRRELEGVTLRELGRLMYEAVVVGAEIDEVVETRPEWNDYRYHHDLRIEIAGRKVYIETRLNFSEPIEPDTATIIVVNIHDP